MSGTATTVCRDAPRALAVSGLILDRLENGAPERIRTSDPQIRSLVLYPAELRARDHVRNGLSTNQAVPDAIRSAAGSDVPGRKADAMASSYRPASRMARLFARIFAPQALTRYSRQESRSTA